LYIYIGAVIRLPALLYSTQVDSTAPLDCTHVN